MSQERQYQDCPICGEHTGSLVNHLEDDHNADDLDASQDE